MEVICTVAELFFALPQFLVNNLYGFFGVTPPDLTDPFEAIFGCAE